MASDGYWDWEPRSWTDDVVVWLYDLLDMGTHTLVIVGALVATHLFVFVIGLGLLFHPVIAIASLATLVPAVLIVMYLWMYDWELTDQEPLHLLALAFLLGIAFAGLPLAVNTVGFGLLGETSLSLSVLFLIVVTAPLEEMTKLFAVRFGVMDHDHFENAIDGIVYGAVAGLGFAMFENGIYLTQALTDGQLIGVAVSRAAAAPLHVLTTGLAGYYLGLAKTNKQYFGPIVMRGLLIVIAAHALYNASLALGIGLTPGRAVELEPGSTGHIVSAGVGLAIIAAVAVLIVRNIRRYETHLQGSTGDGSDR